MTYEPNICIYHGGCDDGFGAAWAIWRRWPMCIFVAGAHGKPLDLEGVDIDGRNILFVDFSAPADALKALVDDGKADSVIVIDHHVSAETALSEFDQMNDAEHLRFTLENSAENITVWFDMEKSGARMAWEFAHPDVPVPDFIVLIEDRDLWQFAHGDLTRRFAAALKSYPQDFIMWDQLYNKADDLAEEGEGILRAHESNVQRFVAEAYTINLDRHAGVVAVNVPSFYASDVGHALLKAYPDAPFAATWYRAADGLLNFSLRSENHRVDVSMVAGLWGGGGHRNAAGFKLDMVRGGGDFGVGAV